MKIMKIYENNIICINMKNINENMIIIMYENNIIKYER